MTATGLSALCYFAAGPLTSGTQRLIEDDWLEYEELVLRPAVSIGQGVGDAQHRLSEALLSQPFVTGSKISVADTTIFATLLAVPEV